MSLYSWIMRLRQRTLVVIACMAGCLPLAQAFVSQTPAILPTPPDVNIMFTLDDSLSMAWDGAPDALAVVDVWRAPAGSTVLTNTSFSKMDSASTAQDSDPTLVGTGMTGAAVNIFYNAAAFSTAGTGGQLSATPGALASASLIPVRPSDYFLSGSNSFPAAADKFGRVYFFYWADQAAYNANQGLPAATVPPVANRIFTMFTGGKIVEFQSTNRFWRYFRSNAGNPIYYDPTVLYTPWPTSANDKTLHTPASPTAVIIDYGNSNAPTTVATAGSTNVLNITQRVNVTGGAGAADAEANNFWPATYFVYNTAAGTLTAGAATNATANFTKVEIKPSVTAYTKYPARTDCTGASCTYTQELQNFANWLQYYRTRMLTAKASVSTAFARQGTNLRIGYARLGQGVTAVDETSATTRTVQLGVRAWSGANRTNLYNALYTTPFNSVGTPLLQAMDDVGQYFSRAAGYGSPYNLYVGDSSKTAVEAACRKNFHIMSTDGYWNAKDAGGGDFSPLVPPSTTVTASNRDDWGGQTPPAAATAPRPVYKIAKDVTGASSGANQFAAHPYREGNGQSVTLADVAAYYWKTDLRTDLQNIVKPTSRDDGYWQHVTTYTVGIGISGTRNYTAIGTTSQVNSAGAVTNANPASSFVVSTGSTVQAYSNPQSHLDYAIFNKYPMDGSATGAIAWPTVQGSRSTTGDDLIHASVNGHGRYFLAGNPAKFASDLATAINEAADQSAEAAGLASGSTCFTCGENIYQGVFDPNGWFGKLYAFSQNTSSGAIVGSATVDVNDTAANNGALWEASEKLPAFNLRNVFSADISQGIGQQGITATWSSGLTSTQRGYLNNNSKVLDYLLGDSSQEVRKGGAFRNRLKGVLGDIVGSNPIEPLAKSVGYENLPSTHGGSTYATYISTDYTNSLKKSVFVGANDGMAHAFASDTGVERFAYIPESVFFVERSEPDGTGKAKLAYLTDIAYTHRFTVDGSPALGDAYIKDYTDNATKWSTILVQSTGAGARGVFALNVRDPGGASASTWKKNVLWEYSSNTPNFTSPVATPNADMGYVLGAVPIGILPDGTWAAFFGNGYASTSGKAILNVINLETGVPVIAPIVVDSTGSNGLSQPQLLINSKRQVIAAYAGDLKGNMWKFDFSGSNSSSWGVAFSGVPLMTAKNDSGVAQPIVVQPEIAFPTTTNVSGPIILFGTGKFFESEDRDKTLPANLRVQSLYGVWDNGSPVDLTTRTLRGSGGQLQRQGRINVIAGTNTGATTDLGANGFSATTKATFTYGTTSSDKRGWFFDLMPKGSSTTVAQGPNTDLTSVPTTLAATDPQGERLYINPALAGSLVAFAPNAPAQDECNESGVGSLLVLDPATGGAPQFNVFDTNRDGLINSSDGSGAAGSVYLNERKTTKLITQPLFQTKSSTSTALNLGQTSTAGGRLEGVAGQQGCGSGNESGQVAFGSGDSTKNVESVNLCAPSTPGRVTWRQLQ